MTTTALALSTVGVVEHIEALNSRYAAHLKSSIAHLLVRIGDDDTARFEVVELQNGTYAFIDFDTDTESVTFVQDSDPIELFKKVEDWRDEANIGITDEMLAAVFTSFWTVVYGFSF